MKKKKLWIAWNLNTFLYMAFDFNERRDKIYVFYVLIYLYWEIYCMSNI